VGSPPSAQCGRADFMDMHINFPILAPDGGLVSGGDNSAPQRPFPTECANSGMSPQEMALEYLFFQTAGCTR
jgi:hypothetical protein